ncbi:MAG: MGDG synthase family glycosyltransferase [Phycisphaerae bacterium]
MGDHAPILILTASAGAGHGVAAIAVAEALQKRLPGAAVIVHDVLESANAFFRNLYANGYLGLVRHMPAAFGMIYEATDRPARNMRRNLRSWFQNINSRRTMRHIEGLRPRLIINTHFLSAEIVAHMRSSGRLTCPQVTVTTDFETHRLWAQPPTERYYTATEEGREYLTTWGADPAHIRVTGIPVRAAFAEPTARADACARLGLIEDLPLILMLCGGFGVGPVEDFVRALLQLQTPAQIAVIAGRNPKLQARLDAIAAGATPRLRVVGFTDEMHVWMRAASLVVSKPGGLTAAEALAVGVPLVIVNPIPGQESRNSDYLLENRAAIRVHNARLLRFRIDRLLADEPRLTAMAAAARCLGRPNAATDVVEDAITFLAS